MVIQKSVLGKGLASLLPGAVGTVPEVLIQEHEPMMFTKEFKEKEISTKDRHSGISLVSPQEIQVNPYQPRRSFSDTSLQELAQSIEANGIIQPLIVRKTKEGQYELIAGERRLRAAQKLNLKQVPIVLKKSTDRESLELALIENIQREDLNCVDEALAYFQLNEEFQLTQEEIAKRVGKERATVANALRLLRLPDEILADLRQGILSAGHGKVLLSLEERALKLQLRALIIAQHWSVREAEAWVQAQKEQALSKDSSEKQSQQTSRVGTAFSRRMKQLSQELTHYWSAQVEVQGSDKKGKIVIYYHTQEELDRLIEDMHTRRSGTSE